MAGSYIDHLLQYILCWGNKRHIVCKQKTCYEEIYHTVDVVYTWKYGGPHIIITICGTEMKLCVYNAYVL